MRISFLYLRAFSKTGGIEKFNKMFMFALQNVALKNNYIISCISAYDTICDKNYLHPKYFKGFNINKLTFTFFSLKKAFRDDIIILAHINLASIGFLIKIFFPSKQVFLITHGIEVWQKQSYFKKYILKKADKILVVSEYTKNIIIKNHQIDEKKFVLFPNTFDPIFDWPSKFQKNINLINKYAIHTNSKVLITVSRLEYSEKYKGYDNVIEVLPEILKLYPNLKYLIIGKGDEKELLRINKLIEKNNLQNNVLLTGFVSDSDLIDYYLLGDVFVMPSKKEGFGIVFIEAILCGLQVIAGNKDASKEALLNGKVGILVDPDSKDEIKNAIIKSIENPINNNQKIEQAKKINDSFNIEAFQNRLENVFKN